MEVRSKRKAVIVDVDGTLVDVSSIRHHIREMMNEDGSWKRKNFDAFHRDSVNCPPILETLAHVHYWAASGHAILIVTARSRKYYGPTAWWLAEHAVPHDELYMRSDGDYRKDFIVKKEILARIEQRFEVVHAIDDNPSVIDLWTSEGIETTVIPGWEEHA